MRNRTVLFLLELLAMVLVFALAAAVCLQGFAAAAEQAEETARQDGAVVLARNGAEAVKAARGDLAEAARILGGAAGEDTLVLDREGCRLEIVLQDSAIPGLGQALVQVTGDGAVLVSLTAAWQEVE